MIYLVQSHHVQLCMLFSIRTAKDLISAKYLLELVLRFQYQLSSLTCLTTSSYIVCLSMYDAPEHWPYPNPRITSKLPILRFIRFSSPMSSLNLFYNLLLIRQFSFPGAIQSSHMHP